MLSVYGFQGESFRILGSIVTCKIKLLPDRLHVNNVHCDSLEKFLDDGERNHRGVRSSLPLTFFAVVADVVHIVEQGRLVKSLLYMLCHLILSQMASKGNLVGKSEDRQTVG